MSVLKVGDVCEVFTTCCQASRSVVGAVVTVWSEPFGNFKCGCCGKLGGAAVCVDSDSPSPDEGTNVVHVPVKFLRLRRPPSWDEWLTKDTHLTDEDRREAELDRLIPLTVPKQLYRIRGERP